MRGTGRCKQDWWVLMDESKYFWLLACKLADKEMKLFLAACLCKWLTCCGIMRRLSEPSVELQRRDSQSSRGWLKEANEHEGKENTGADRDGIIKAWKCEGNTTVTSGRSQKGKKKWKKNIRDENSEGKYHRDMKDNYRGDEKKRALARENYFILFAEFLPLKAK